MGQRLVLGKIHAQGGAQDFFAKFYPLTSTTCLEKRATPGSNPNNLRHQAASTSHHITWSACIRTLCRSCNQHLASDPLSRALRPHGHSSLPRLPNGASVPLHDAEVAATIPRPTPRQRHHQLEQPFGFIEETLNDAYKTLINSRLQIKHHGGEVEHGSN